MKKTLLLAALLTVAACSKKEQPAPEAGTATTPPATTSSASATTTAAANANGDAPSLTSFTSGALIVQKPQEYSDGWAGFLAFDGRADTGWASPQNVVTPQTMVIALAERSQLDRLVFDTASADGPGRAAKDIVVEMSDTSATEGFQPIATIALQDAADNQTFPVTAQVPGRWLRVQVKSNHGAQDYIELMDVRGYGKQLAHTPFPNASGTYETNYGNFHLRQEGTSVTGCYEHDGGLLNGGIEGRIMKFTWREAGEDKGPAIMVFTSDGQTMFGRWWNEGDSSGPGGTWDGKKISNEVGSCPNWSGGAEAALTKELEEFGRTRLYGINFDVDSDRIRDESKPTLDKIVAMLKAKADWKLKIEGHTDSTGSEERNQQLSQLRAAAVVTYLSGAGIDAARLSANGFGASQPIAPNTNEQGRAQNRRVELVKE